MPSALSALEASSKLGARLSALLDPDTPVNGVTAGKIEAPLLGFGVLSRIDGKPLKPTNLAVSSGWGHRTTTGIVMPGAGRIELGGAYNDDKVSDILGPPIDVMLNGVASWRAVPANVWSCLYSCRSVPPCRLHPFRLAGSLPFFSFPFFFFFPFFPPIKFRLTPPIILPGSPFFFSLPSNPKQRATILLRNDWLSGLIGALLW